MMEVAAVVVAAAAALAISRVNLAKAGIFFFQAEDGIRDYKVTGVQTCALPICRAVVAFTLGGVGGVSARLLLAATPLVVVGGAAAWWWGRTLDVLLSGEEEAKIGRASCRERV